MAALVLSYCSSPVVMRMSRLFARTSESEEDAVQGGHLLALRV